MRINEQELKRRWPTGVLRPRVVVYRNDGGELQAHVTPPERLFALSGAVQDQCSTMVYSLQSVLDFASKVMLHRHTMMHVPVLRADSLLIFFAQIED